MNYEIEKQKTGVKINFSVSKPEWDSEITAAYNKNKAKYNVPGFRKGFAPKKIIESMYGANVFFDDAFNSCASANYSKVLKEHEEIFVVDEPKVDITDFGETELKFCIEVSTKPEVTLGAYKGLKLEKSVYPIGATEVDEEINKALKAKSRLIDVTDRAVKDGDTVKLDYSGSVDGVKFDGGTAENQELVIGSKSFIPGFEEQLIGLSIADNKDINVKFPENYHAEELKGKEAIFNVTIHAIKVSELPELNDEFVKDTTKFENVKDYRADIESNLAKKAEARATSENQNKLIAEVGKNAEVEIPQCMIDSELDYMLQDFEYRLSYMYGGMKIADYFKYTNTSAADFKKDRAEDAKQAVKTRLVIEEIIKQEKIEATDVETDAKLAEIANQANKTLQEYKPTVSAQQLNHINNDIVVGKVFALLEKENTLEIVDKNVELTEKVEKKTKSTTKAKKETEIKE